MSEIGVEGAPETDAGRRVLQGLGSIVVVGLIFVFVIPKFADYSDVWAAIADMTGLEIVTLVAVTLWNLVTYWFVLVAVLPGLSYSQAAVANQASTAVANTIPGGGALGVGVTYAMYSSWGFSNSEIALSVLVSGIWNNFAKLGFPIIALALLAIEGDAGAALVTASLVGVAFLIVVIAGFGFALRSEAIAERLGDGLSKAVSALRKLIRKPPILGWGTAARGFRAQTLGLLHQRWFGLSLATLISHSSLYLVLLMALRHVGVSQEDVGWVEVLAAFAFVRLISALPITPGGLGVVELGYVAALTVGLTQTTSDQVVAAILLFRFLTFFTPVPLGAVSYTVWRRNKAWRRREPVRARPPES